ncbi:hypothetical protein BSL78_24838 [Apostichopus japonicus]|uniref:Reverse transcriptase/retrotransposon-derived protein RNase H-like domain-containing protein n=1 Tax=Stichopus japonicus TaxID=307972 RepID=A0A2G8JRM1_STIJA|nr:hypothetical protein BSL78_24838 [Apostichopus japonicus]
MGHKLSSDGICPSDEKVEAIKDARQPTSASEVRSFLGLVQYCSRFIPNLATISEPLRRLTKKGQTFSWGKEQEQSFQSLKNVLTKADTLAYFDKNAKTQVISDASPVGLGAILVQIQNGEARIIGYASRSLTDVERRYSQTEKEALGLQSRTRVNIGEEHIRFVAQNAAPVAIPIKKIEDESSVDEELSLLRDCIQKDNWSELPTPYKMVRNELAVVGYLVLRGNRIVIPKVLRAQVVELAHEGHQGIVKSKQRLRTKVWWPGADRDIESKCKTCHGCQVVGLA